MRITPVGTYADPITGAKLKTLERLCVAYVDGKMPRLVVASFLIVHGLRRDHAYSTGDLAHACALILAAPVGDARRRVEVHAAIRCLTDAGLDALEDVFAGHPVASASTRALTEAERLHRIGLTDDWTIIPTNGGYQVYAKVRAARASA